MTLLLTFAPEAQLRGMVFWLLGDLNGATHWVAVWLALVVALALSWPWAHQLDWLARGDAWAATLGVPVERRRRQVLVASALATGAAVATGGAIGFVGLVAPHALRLLGLRRAPWLLPASALAGVPSAPPHPGRGWTKYGESWKCGFFLLNTCQKWSQQCVD